MFCRSLFLLCFAFVPAFALAEGSVGEISGMVVELKSGAPVVGAQISVMQKRGRSKEQSEVAFTTDSNIEGRFSIAGVPSGSYDVAVVHPEQGVGVERDVAVGPNTRAELLFKLGMRSR